MNELQKKFVDYLAEFQYISMKNTQVFFIHVLFVSPHKGAHCIERPGFRCAKWGVE